jgi:tetratricopeptide (TPR) repeat protein
MSIPSLIRYIIGYYALAWLERDRGNHDRAQSLLQAYLDADREPDEYTDHMAGVLGHWLWHFSNRTDAEPLLRRGALQFSSARADLGHLLKATGRVDEAEVVLREGVAAGRTGQLPPPRQPTRRVGSDRRSGTALS